MCSSMLEPGMVHVVLIALGYPPTKVLVHTRRTGSLDRGAIGLPQISIILPTLVAVNTGLDCPALLTRLLLCGIVLKHPWLVSQQYSSGVSVFGHIAWRRRDKSIFPRDGDFPNSPAVTDDIARFPAPVATPFFYHLLTRATAVWFSCVTLRFRPDRARSASSTWQFATVTPALTRWWTRLSTGGAAGRWGPSTLGKRRISRRRRPRLGFEMWPPRQVNVHWLGRYAPVSSFMPTCAVRNRDEVLLVAHFFRLKTSPFGCLSP